ncbi:hypothetical protein IM797_16755 [Pedobacter sp. MC2016-24]|nr:hypothetical protein [Pedobacter sp. MC2016-24]
MRMNRLLTILLLFVVIFFSACEKEDASLAPAVKMLVTDPAINGKVNEGIVFMAINMSNNTYQQEWKLDDVLQSDSAAYKFTPLKPGVYKVDYTAVNDGGVFNYSYSVNVGIPTVPVTSTSKAYTDILFSFLPASSTEMGKLESLEAARSLEGKKGFVSMSGSGGYIVLGFDHTVINETDKNDLIIFTKKRKGYAMPEKVWVMQDENGNRKPDDTWYELKNIPAGESDKGLYLDIANAADADGNKVSLGGIDFIKIESGVSAHPGHKITSVIGIQGIADLNLLK